MPGVEVKRLLEWRNSQMEDIEINIVDLSNSVKVVNLLPNPIHFDDGTVVPPTRYRLRLSTLKRTLNHQMLRYGETMLHQKQIM